MTVDPASFFARYGLPLAGLHRVNTGYCNEVWMTDTAVIRLGASTDHAFEASVALGALAAGVQTARPLAWGDGFSVWQRLPGGPPRAEQLTRALWDAVLADLERLHARPPVLPIARTHDVWTGDASLVDRTHSRAAWTAEEYATLRALLSEPYPLTAPVFVHGDVYSPNILVDDQGLYAGLIDWGNARWATLEHECACLDDMTVAFARWRGHLNLGLVWRVRLELLLYLAAKTGRVPFTAVRNVLLQLEEGP